MPIMQGKAAGIAAGASSGNVLAGQQFEFVGEPSMVEVYCTASQDGVKGTFQIGSDVVADEAELSKANRSPIKPDDMFVDDGAAPGSRLSLKFRNGAGTASDVYWRVEVKPL